MIPPSTLFGLIFSAIASPLGPPAGDAPCAPARLGPNVAAQPEAWRRAVEALVAETAAPGQPWSCVGGEVDLVATEGAATLAVEDAEGHTITREVTSPDDVEPLGEALLAKPLPAPPETEEKTAEATKPANAASPAPAPPEVRTSPAMTNPRLFVSATLGPRYAGPSHFVWGGATLAATLPPRPWGGGVWLRYDGISVPLEMHSAPMREVAIGASAIRSFGMGPLELRAAVGPSLAVVTRDERRDGGAGAPSEPDPAPRGETHFDFRLGAEAKLVFPLVSILRGAFALDVEASPFELGRGADPRDPQDGFPAYTLGLGLGVEVSIP